MNVHHPFVSYYNDIISITFRSLVDILSISLLKCRKQQHKYMSNPAVFVVDLFENCISIWFLTLNSAQNNF